MRFAILLSPLLSLAAAGAASAQTYTWNGNGGNGNWNTAANWTGGLPVSANNTVIQLNNTTQTATIQNIANPFQLNQLVMQVDATSGFSVGGSALQFGGTAPVIRNEAAALLTVSAPITFAADTAIVPAANNVNNAEIRLSGSLTAAAGVTVTVGAASSPLGTMVLLDGSSPGFAGTWAVTNNTLTQASAPNALGRGAGVTTTGQASGFVVGRTAASGFSDAGTAIQLRSVAGTGSFQVGTTASASVAAVGFGNANFDITGLGTLSSANAGSHFAKVGTGTFTHSGAEALFAGTFSVRDGLVNLSGSSSVSGGFGTASTGAITVYAGAELRESITGTGLNGRIGDTQAANLRGGTLRLDASGLGASGTGFSEVLGALNVGAGQSVVRIDTSAGRGAELNFTSLAQTSATGTVLFRSGNLGTATLNTAGSGNVNFATNPNSLFVGTTAGYAAGTTNLRVLPFGTAAASATGDPATFVAFDTTSASLRGLAAGDYAAAFGAADLNVSLGAAAAANGNAVNALRLTAGGSVTTSGTGLTISSGALLNAGGGDITGSGPLNFGAGGAATAHVTANGAATISAPIAASNFAKGGSGNLSIGAIDLSAAAGPRAIAVNAGTLTLNGTVTPGTLSPTNTLTYQVSRGATLNAPSAIVLGGNQILQGGGTQATGAGAATVVGLVAVADGGTIRASSLGGPSGSLASPGVLTIDGNVVFVSGGTYEWYVNSVQGPNTEGGTTTHYTQSLLNATGSLDLDSLSSANRFTVRVTTLTMGNAAGQVYDYDGGNYTATIGTFAGGISGFAANKFNLVYNPSDFAGPGATLTIAQIDDSLVIHLSPVPEPRAVLALAAGVLGLAALVRRRRTPAAAR
jgi:hypothetical protein